MLKGLMNRVVRAVSIALIAVSAVGGIGAVSIATAEPAQAYTWSQKWYNSQTKKYWAYKTCTRDEWFNGCTNGWYQASYHWSLWG